MGKRKSIECYLCSATIEKNVVGLNKKLLGEKTARRYCLSCLADYLETNEDDLNDKIEEFKEQGCTLFV